MENQKSIMENQKSKIENSIGRRKFFSCAAVVGTVGALSAGTMLTSAGCKSAALAASSGSPLTNQGVFSQKTVYNIREFGAVGDGETLNTDAINNAISKCSEDGGGRVVIPVGIFKSGTIQMKNNVELHIEMGATLLGSGDYRHYPKQAQPEFRTHLDPEGWFALIYGCELSNIAVTGLGTINGNGAALTGIPGHAVTHSDEMFGRPRAILFISCKQVRIEGLKMLASGSWMQHYLDCEDVIVDQIEVFNHSNKNNDLIDIDGCRRFTLSNSILDSDDDGITFKSSGAAPSEDVTITNCVVSSCCNAIKMGTGSSGGFRNVSITNCVVKHTRDKAPGSILGGFVPKNGITGISLQIVDGGIMEGIAISNIVMEDIECPIFIWLGNRARPHTPSAPRPQVGKLRNVAISNIVAYNTGNMCSSISGIPGHCVENVIIDNIQLFNRGGVTEEAYANPAAFTGHKNVFHAQTQIHSDYRRVPEKERDYPEAQHLGFLPSSVFFIRNVKNLSINNLMFASYNRDIRTPIIAVNTEGLRIGKSIFSGDEVFPQSYVLLNNVKEYEVEKPLGWGDNEVLKIES